MQLGGDRREGWGMVLRQSALVRQPGEICTMMRGSSSRGFPEPCLAGSWCSSAALPELLRARVSSSALGLCSRCLLVQRRGEVEKTTLRKEGWCSVRVGQRSSPPRRRVNKHG